MIEELFEWDVEKETANFRKHGVAFHEAILVIRDPLAVERMENREDYGEERINMVGVCGTTILYVTYTERNNTIRIISARRAEKHEQEDYHRENSI